MRKITIGVITAAIILGTLVVGYFLSPWHGQPPAQAGAPNYGSGIPVDRQDRFFAYVLSTMNALMQEAPTFDRTQLGSGTAAFSWRGTAVLGSIYMTADGTQFALEDVNDTGFNGSAGAVGVLDRGRFSPFNIPENGQMNNVLSFVSQKGPVVRIAHDEDAQPHLYALTRAGAVPFAPSASSLQRPGDVPPGTMLEPNCVDVRSKPGPFALVPSTAQGIDVSRAALSAASRGLTKYPSVGVACYRFAGRQFVSISFSNEIGMTFLFDRGRLQPAIRSFPFLRTPRYLVFHLAESSADPIYQDYLEVVTTSVR